ncbi:DNA-binding response regulator [Amycolatopsis balhimycina DSM 5908]|uniref:DNA-binding response regulator n=1 Tax=Amycolatopsis balhimycina DSM 5908 TaxID=1081091 RepID=A0A428WB79_AMYBA|nr:response regulator transcription factor [Amycolatopsis balhimycina]RSM40350.1 DNA-binding response regulator [Amycolatopsis balhimycina DSM 5908]
MISVVVADDEQLIRAGVRGLLETAGDIKVVAEAGSGSEALRLAHRHQPDVLLLDIHMPDGDGLATAELVGRHVPATAVAMLTAFSDDRYVLRALHAGAAGFLLKDTEPRVLLDAVRAIAAGKGYLSPQVTCAVLARLRDRDPRRAERAQARLASLTGREREVLRPLAQGQSNAEIARTCRMSEGSVKAHISRMLVKLECANRVQLALIAYEAAES